MMALVLVLPLLAFRGKRRGRPGRVIALTFHDIADLSQFKMIIERLGRFHPFLNAGHFDDFMSSKLELDQDHWLVTFDDGFFSSKMAAQQVLDPLGISALFFVCPDHLASGTLRETHPLNGAEKAMTWSDVKELEAGGHIVGAHGMSHRVLSEIKDAGNLFEEIAGPRFLLEKMGVSPQVFMAFPRGTLESVSPGSLEIALSHYKYVFSGIRGTNTPATPRGALKREHISLDDPWPTQVFSALGGFSIFYLKKSRQLNQMATAAASAAAESGRGSSLGRSRGGNAPIGLHD